MKNKNLLTISTLVFAFLLVGIAYAQTYRVYAGIYDDTTGSPLPADSVTITGTGGFKQTLTNVVYAIFTVSPDTYTVEAIKSGYQTGTATVYVTNGNVVKNLYLKVSSPGPPADTIAPTVNAQIINEGNRFYRLEATITDSSGIASVLLEIDGSDVTLMQNSGVYYYSSQFVPGDHNYAWAAMDNAGNVKTYTGSFNVPQPPIPTQDPVCSDFTTTPSSGVAYFLGATYTFTATCTDATAVNFVFNGRTYAAQNSGNVYTATVTDLAANPSGYANKWIANGETTVDFPQPAYIVNKALNSVEVLINDQPIPVYPLLQLPLDQPINVKVRSAVPLGFHDRVAFYIAACGPNPTTAFTKASDNPLEFTFNFCSISSSRLPLITAVTGLSTGNQNYTPARADSRVFLVAPTGPTDTTPPVVTITSPQQGATLNSRTVQIDFTVNEATSWTAYKLDDGSVTEMTGTSIALNDVTNGAHTVTVYARDIAGNEGSATVSFTVSVDDSNNNNGNNGNNNGNLGGGGSGSASGSGGSIISALKITAPPVVSAVQGSERTFTVRVDNVGEGTLTSLAVSLDGIPSEWITVDPISISQLNGGESYYVTIHVNVPANENVGERTVTARAIAHEITTFVTSTFKINIKPLGTVIEEEETLPPGPGGLILGLTGGQLAGGVVLILALLGGAYYLLKRGTEPYSVPDDLPKPPTKKSVPPPPPSPMTKEAVDSSSNIVKLESIDEQETFPVKY